MVGHICLRVENFVFGIIEVGFLSFDIISRDKSREYFSYQKSILSKSSFLIMFQIK